VVHLETPANISLTGKNGAPVGTQEMTIPNGTSLAIEATPVDASGQTLDGTLDYTWSLDNTNYVDFATSFNKTAHATLVAKAVGTGTKLHVQAGDALMDIGVRVQ
jgi:hypothetical protein